MARALCLGSFALMLLAVNAAPARADAALFPWRKPTPRPPLPTPPSQDEASNPVPAPQPNPAPQQPPQPEPPKRTGPFRSCGSGAGTGLVCIGAAWAMLWLGNRVAGHITRRAKTDPTE
ncbi:hypothetical protein [Frigoriglobus tundricola]|uniref:Uncharacterized protein n=1 Tax=Frigoriglobus tundricola TaxID=2774151 RepID=A0A6M5YVD7_9BACT|nr:hypothetical protein [Frigoriglobus tundricola]QJW97909.1 hypothetical protein FTUN_5489 [Frigoriglobus tundricola]